MNQPGPLILLVEDELELGRLILRELQAAGYQVRHAPDGTMALQLFSEEPPDLVVLDWERLAPGPVRRVRDLPGGGDRLVTDQPDGIVHVVVNGTPIRRDERQLDDLSQLPGGSLAASPASAGASA